MRNKSMLLGLLAMAAMTNSTRGTEGNQIFENLTDGESKKVIPTNHKEYTIEGVTVTALSHKRAIDKVRKILSKTGGQS